MTAPASVIGDTHVCPLSDGPKPHVGGVVAPPGVPTVLAMNRPLTPMANTCPCVGPPDMSAKGSGTVLTANRGWVRIGIDTKSHGGVITGPGATTIIVGG